MLPEQIMTLTAHVGVESVVKLGAATGNYMGNYLRMEDTDQDFADKLFPLISDMEEFEKEHAEELERAREEIRKRAKPQPMHVHRDLPNQQGKRKDGTQTKPIPSPMPSPDQPRQRRKNEPMPAPMPSPNQPKKPKHRQSEPMPPRNTEKDYEMRTLPAPVSPKGQYKPKPPKPEKQYEPRTLPLPVVEPKGKYRPMPLKTDQQYEPRTLPNKEKW